MKLTDCLEWVFSSHLGLHNLDQPYPVDPCGGHQLLLDEILQKWFSHPLSSHSQTIRPLQEVISANQISEFSSKRSFCLRPGLCRTKAGFERNNCQLGGLEQLRRKVCLVCVQELRPIYLLLEGQPTNAHISLNILPHTSPAVLGKSDFRPWGVGGGLHTISRGLWRKLEPRLAENLRPVL